MEREKTRLEEEVAGLHQQLAARQQRLQQLAQQERATVRAAIRAAGLVGIMVPEKYRKAAAAVGRPPRAGTALYRWTPAAQAGKAPPTPRELPLATALWSYSKGSGGSAGRGQGVLSVDQFKALLQAQHGKTELAPGESVIVEFGNGRRVELTRLAAEPPPGGAGQLRTKR